MPSHEVKLLSPKDHSMLCNQFPLRLQTFVQTRTGRTKLSGDIPVPMGCHLADGQTGSLNSPQSQCPGAASEACDLDPRPHRHRAYRLALLTQIILALRVGACIDGTQISSKLAVRRWRAGSHLKRLTAHVTTGARNAP